MNISRLTAFTAMAFAVWFSSIPGAAAPVRPIGNSMILARSGNNALLIWNATSYVTKLVSEKVLGDDGLRAIEATALAAAAEKAATITSATVNVRVLYERSGSVSPVYGTATFTGMENLLTLTAPRADLVRNGTVWSAQLADGRIPQGVKITISGKLPAAQ